MAKDKITFGDVIAEIKDDVTYSGKESNIPDIITFCDSEDWLALPFHPTNPIVLYPVQRILLKAFYRGSLGNENLKLTEKEIEKCREIGLVDDDKGNVVEKYESGEIFKELVLVWGRRSGKDFCVSIIALYEAMKLLECEGGDPYAIYEISSANTINILTIANAKPQAHIAFEEIKDKLLYSNYFKNKHIPEGITSSAIYLLTPKDKELNKDFKDRGIPPRKGSVGIVVGHSNSDTLLGMGCIVLILDEVASYKTTGGASSGDRIYTALTPTLKTYCRRTYAVDENGVVKRDENGQKIVIKRVYDGKTISISSPRGKEGKFYDLFNTAREAPDRLVCRIPTWEVNITHTRESLRKETKTMSETEFNMEFGAEFSGIGMENFFTEDQVAACFSNNLRNVSIGKPGETYFGHLDPATSSHNYALVIVHRETYVNIHTQKSEFIIVVDHIKYWRPEGGPINPDIVVEYVTGLKRRFHLGLLTYDQWASVETILKLRKAGIPNKETRFNGSHKNIIYRELENLVNEGRIKIPYEYLLKAEMEELQRKFTPVGFKVFPKKEGDGVKSDDICDALAGACYGAIGARINRLPRGKTVETGISPQANNTVWRNMQGGAFYGPGQQVTNQLEKRASWPSYKR
jgi:hypothetical protein